MAASICESYQHTARRLSDLGLDYLALDRASATLSTGERQRVQLARAVRNRTTGVLYVLDQPSIGLHPSNIDGLLEVMRASSPTATRWSWWITTRTSCATPTISWKWAPPPA
ncbi:hypothetical protein, partial [Eggerthella sinensis]|uniref:hypothetical protein n=1 Tax=Eggerthella sinensis TaxID=242230 RepID=UPI0022E24012